MCLGAYLPTFCEDIARPTCFSCGCMGEQDRFCQHRPFPNGLLGTSDDVLGEAATGFYGTKNGPCPLLGKPRSQIGQGEKVAAQACLAPSVQLLMHGDPRPCASHEVSTHLLSHASTGPNKTKCRW